MGERENIMQMAETLRGKCLAYREKKEAFAQSHKPRHCDYCGTDIEPGADVIVDAVHVFCDYECCAAFNNAERLIFNDDDEYKSIFEKREDGK
jgi:hypothetical protein